MFQNDILFFFETHGSCVRFCTTDVQFVAQTHEPMSLHSEGNWHTLRVYAHVEPHVDVLVLVVTAQIGPLHFVFLPQFGLPLQSPFP